MKRLTLLTLVAILTLVGILPALAQIDEPIIEPMPPLLNPEAYLKTHRIDVTIDNQVATTRIEQVFANDGDRPAEGTYLFPLPRGASVNDLVMYVDGQAIQSKILGSDEAREIYEEIVRRLRDPALLEYVGQDAIQANVFPIPPRDEVKIEIEYTHILTVENGLVQYEYPLRTDQFSPQPVRDIAVSVEVISNDEIGAIYSPTHRIAVSEDDGFGFRAGYENANIREVSDFKLYYSLASDTIDVNLLTYRESANQDGFFLLLVAPPSQLDASQIVPRDVIIVLDQSGSMFGDKWEQARDATKFVLDNLNPEDRFNIVSFSTGWRIYGDGLQNPSEADRAKNWLDGLEAVGGTDIDGALTEAFKMADGERQAVILFLTDGLPTEGETDIADILDNAAQNAPNNARLFTFGVGDDVDTFLLDTLNTDFRGAGVYVRPNERIDEEVETLYSKISAPVMTDIEIDFGDARVEDLYPQLPLPDLFVGSQLIIAGRYRDGVTSDITLTGEINGERQSITYENLEFASNAGGEVSIPRLWATRKIGALLNSIRLNGENPELVESIVRLSTRYGIITPYTSFLIEEDDIFTQQGRDDAAQRATTELDALDEESTGAFAVGAADDAASMEEAEVAAPAPTSSTQNAAPAEPADGEGFTTDADMGRQQQNPLQFVNDKTFLWRDGVWIDSAYDADSMTPTEIVFLSDEYFALLDEFPEIVDYLSLGEEIIIVLEDVVFKIVSE